MLPPDQAEALADLERRHHRAAVVKCRGGRYTALIGEESLPLETIGQRALRIPGWKYIDDLKKGDSPCPS